MEDYKDHVNHFRSKLYSGHYVDATIEFYMDGKRSVWEIAKETMIETRDSSIEYVHNFVQLLRSYNLVEILGEKN